MLYYQDNAQWKIAKLELKPYTLKNIDGMVSVVIHLQRRPEYFAFTILAPIFLTLLSESICISFTSRERGANFLNGDHIFILGGVYDTF